MGTWSKEKTEYREALAKIHAKMKKVSRNNWKSQAWNKLMDAEYKLKVDTIKKVGYEEFESHIL
jgi:hypothetical protein